MRDWTDAKTNTSITSAAKPLLMFSRVMCYTVASPLWFVDDLPEFSKQTDSQW